MANFVLLGVYISLAPFESICSCIYNLYIPRLLVTLLLFKWLRPPGEGPNSKRRGQITLLRGIVIDHEELNLFELPSEQSVNEMGKLVQDSELVYRNFKLESLFQSSSP